jgi:16S rRNA pseudouridine516 synthase
VYEPIRWQAAGVSPLRVDRILSNLGYATRTEARALVGARRVAVDGQTVRDPAQKAEPEAVTLDGEALEAPHGLFAAFHKPEGYVCSHEDRDGSRIWELLPPRWLERNPKATTVGRLDKDSSGLLLVTDLLPLVHELTSPRHHVPKRYVVTLEEAVDDLDEVVERFASGALVLRGEEDDPCLPAELRALDDDRYEVVLTEGRHRQLRRMFGACGDHVATLHRTAVGPYELGDLPAGAWRFEDPSLVTERLTAR